jgi:hypothetical protein
MLWGFIRSGRQQIDRVKALFSCSWGFVERCCSPRRGALDFHLCVVRPTGGVMDVCSDINLLMRITVCVFVFLCVCHI